MYLTAAGSRTWSTEADCDPHDFRTLVEQAADPRVRPCADCVQQSAPRNDGDPLRVLTATKGSRRQVQAGVDAEVARRRPLYAETAAGGGLTLVGDAANGGDPARLRARGCGCDCDCDCDKVGAEGAR